MCASGRPTRRAVVAIVVAAGLAVARAVAVVVVVAVVVAREDRPSVVFGAVGVGVVVVVAVGGCAMIALRAGLSPGSWSGPEDAP